MCQFAERGLGCMKPPDLTKAAFAYLARYATSTGNLRVVLKRRLQNWGRKNAMEIAAHLPQIEEAVAACARLGLLDDAHYAASQTVVMHQRGWPARRIAAALQAKGVQRLDAQAALEQQPEDADAIAAARYAERRRLGPWSRGDRAARRERDIAAMMRAGFRGGLAREVIDSDAMPVDWAPIL